MESSILAKVTKNPSEEKECLEAMEKRDLRNLISVAVLEKTTKVKADPKPKTKRTKKAEE